MSGFQQFADEARTKTPIERITASIRSAIEEAGYAVRTIPMRSHDKLRLDVAYPDETLRPATVTVERHDVSDGDQFRIYFDGNGHDSFLATSKVTDHAVAQQGKTILRKMQVSDPAHPRQAMRQETSVLSLALNKAFQEKGLFYSFESSLDGNSIEYAVRNTRVAGGEAVHVTGEADESTGYRIRVDTSEGRYSLSSATIETGALLEAARRVVHRMETGLDPSMFVAESFEPAVPVPASAASVDGLDPDVADTLASALMTDISQAIEFYQDPNPKHGADVVTRIDELLAASDFIARFTSPSVASVLSFELEGLRPIRDRIEATPKAKAPSP